jgi:hypothetical protein
MSGLFLRRRLQGRPGSYRWMTLMPSSCPFTLALL